MELNDWNLHEFKDPINGLYLDLPSSILTEEVLPLKQESLETHSSNTKDNKASNSRRRSEFEVRSMIR